MTHPGQQTRLWAETLAWPLWSRSAYEQVTVALRRRFHDVADQATSALASELDRWLDSCVPGTSVYERTSMRARLWLGHDDKIVPLERYVVGVAAQLLTMSGARVQLREGPDEEADQEADSRPRLLERWHRLARALPADLLVAACACNEDMTPVQERVDLIGYEMDPWLRETVAETHLHVGAAVSFSRVWSGLMRRGHELDGSDRKLTRGGDLPFGGPNVSVDVFIGHLLAAAIARLTMAAFLRWRGHGHEQGLVAFTGEPAEQLARRARWPHSDHALVREWLHLLGALTQAAELATRARIHNLWRALSGAAIIDITDLDLAHQALDYLCGPGAEDASFRRLFWQYQRIRNRTFRHLVHNDETPGLGHFTRRYARISALRAPLDDGKYRAALAHQSQGLGLASLEARTSPEGTWHDNVREVRKLAEQARDWQRDTDSTCEVGLVLHFIKTHSCQCGRHHQDPTHPAYGMRCAGWYIRASRQARALSAMVRERPETLFLLRGIDVANLEMALPTWVTVPLFHEVLRAANRAGNDLARRYPRMSSFEPLRVTYHAGEEFRCVSEGLRRIHELVEAGIVGRRARIGHGLALGVDVAGHAAQDQPAEDRLDDLLWEWDRYARGQLAPGSADRVDIVQHQILGLARLIYGPRVDESLLSVEVLAEARRLRLQPAQLARLGYPRAGRPPPLAGARRLLWLYLTDSAVYRRGQQLVPSHEDSATAAVVALQRWLRTHLAERSIAVEASPSSNLAIGRIATLGEHPMFALQPLAADTTDGGADSLPVSINTDNPLTFSTCLRDEYAYVHAALQERGLSPGQAEEWLTRARDAGWRSRFTLPETAQAGFLDHLARRLGSAPR